MKVVWVSANRFGFELLKVAHKLPGLQLACIVTLSADSKTVMYDGVSHASWDRFGSPILRVVNINTACEQIASASPDLLVVCGWRQIIGRSILAIPSKGAIGFHPTLLPHGRGPAPIINTILSGTQESGLSMFYLTEELDDGDIIGQARFRVGPEDHAAEIYNKVVRAGRRLVRTHLPALVEGTAKGRPQAHENATFFAKPSLKDNRIDLSTESLETIYAKIRAFSRPYNGAYIERDGKRLTIWRATLTETH